MTTMVKQLVVEIVALNKTKKDFQKLGTDASTAGRKAANGLAAMNRQFQQTGGAAIAAQRKVGFFGANAGRAMSQFNEKTEKGRQLTLAMASALGSSGSAMGNVAGQAIYYGGTLGYVFGKISPLELGIMGLIGGLTALTAVLAGTDQPWDHEVRSIESATKALGDLTNQVDSAVAAFEREQSGLSKNQILYRTISDQIRDVEIAVESLQSRAASLRAEGGLESAMVAAGLEGEAKEAESTLNKLNHQLIRSRSLLVDEQIAKFKKGEGLYGALMNIATGGGWAGESAPEKTARDARRTKKKSRPMTDAEWLRQRDVGPPRRYFEEQMKIEDQAAAELERKRSERDRAEIERQQEKNRIIEAATQSAINRRIAALDQQADREDLMYQQMEESLVARYEANKEYFLIGTEILTNAMVALAKGGASAFAQSLGKQLQQLAISSLWKSVYETAEGLAALATPGLQATAPGHFAAAVKYAAVAAGAGIAGAALSSGSGGSKSAGSRSSPAMASTGSANRSRSSTSDDDRRGSTIVLNFRGNQYVGNNAFADLNSRLEQYRRRQNPGSVEGAI